MIPSSSFGFSCSGSAAAARASVDRYGHRIETEPDGLLVTLRYTLSEVFYCEEMPWDDGDEGMEFNGQVLSEGVEAFQQRVREGLVIYRRDGRMLRGTIRDSEGEVPEDPVLLNDLSQHDLAIQLHFASADVEQEFETISFDFQSWRLNISTIITCKYMEFPAIQLPVLWNERGLYPLFPRATETVTMDNRRVLVVPALNKQGVGFSTISLEVDHLRHELLLPTSTAIELVDWADEQPAAYDSLNSDQREMIASALLEHAQSRNLVRCSNRVLEAETQRIRWFDRASLRRGLPLAAESVPVATSFVGLIEVFRPPAGSTTTIDHRHWLDVAPSLAFTARRGDAVELRRTGEELKESWQIESAASADIQSVLLPRLPVQYLHILAWGLTGFAALVLFSVGRYRALVVVIGMGAIIGVFLLPTHELDTFRDRIERQLQYAYDSAGGANERHGLKMLQAVCTPELAARLHVDSRRRLMGPGQYEVA